MTDRRHPKKDRVDVLVVGAGPAGTAAATTLAKAGARVAVIDRHALPGSKACAGGLTTSALKPAKLDVNKLPGFADVFDEMVVKGRLGSVSIKKEGPLLVTVDRRAWTESRIDTVRELGVDVSLGERLIGLERNHVVTSLGERRFDVLVAADGAVSRTRRLLGLGSGLTMRAWQIRIAATKAQKMGLDMTRPTVWFDVKRTGSGYAWAFPSGDELRLGCGASSHVLDSRELKRHFFDWIESLGLRKREGRVEAGTIGCGYMGHRFGRVFLAGDAAGLASPLTGEGICQALVSGEEVAREIVDRAYRSHVIPKLASRHRRTHDVLAHPFIRGMLYAITPGLLRVPSIRRATLARYIL
ncbi:MAG: FAD-dependent oxidoreductase [Deltaproteobacteria bacterium]|nr:FAD-dependent oxidoreductase [Deltaproteobacteria bacterium]